MAPEESTEVVLVRIDGRLSQVERAVSDLRGDMREGFASQAFVSKEVYVEQQRSVREYAEETRRIAETGRTVAMATLSFVIVAVGMLLALIKAVAS